MGNEAFEEDSSTESLEEISRQGLSGGSGEHKQDSCDSEVFFADDELERSKSDIKLNKGNTVSKCLRCGNEVKTRNKYCRVCYDTRRLWMPARPTRKLRKKPLRVKSQSDESLLSRTHLSHPRLSPFSILRQMRNCSLEESSSDSNIDYEAERREDRRKRREYVKKILEEDLSSTESSLSEFGDCLKCGLKRPNAIIIHGETAHRALCVQCATLFHARGVPCPLCDRVIDFIIQDDMIQGPHL